MRDYQRVANCCDNGQWAWLSNTFTGVVVLMCFVLILPGCLGSADPQPEQATDICTDCEVICGNGLRDPGEACDKNDFGAKTCASFGYSGGSLTCSSDCSAITTQACSDCTCNTDSRCQMACDCDGDDCEKCGCDTNQWCEAAFTFTAETCACDPDCQPDKQACQADQHCDLYCPENADPDCGECTCDTTSKCQPSCTCDLTDCMQCECDTNNWCEAAEMNSAVTCGCDPDCSPEEKACEADGHCDTYCPLGHDPDC